MTRQVVGSSVLAPLPAPVLVNPSLAGLSSTISTMTQVIPFAFEGCTGFWIISGSRLLVQAIQLP